MTTKEAISVMVTKHGIDGMLSLLALYMEDQAEEYADTGDTGRRYDRAARIIHKAAAEVKVLLAPRAR